MTRVRPGDNNVTVVDGQSAALGLGAGGRGECWIVTVAVAQHLEPGNVCDACSGGGAVS